jgi:hypothetical protein
VPGHDAITQVGRLDLWVAIGDEGVQLDEGIGVEQQLETLARRQFSPFVLLVDAILPAAESSLRTHRIKPRQSLLVRRQGSHLRENSVSLRTDSRHHTVPVIHGNGEQLPSRVDNRVPAMTSAGVACPDVPPVPVIPGRSIPR